MMTSVWLHFADRGVLARGLSSCSPLCSVAVTPTGHLDLGLRNARLLCIQGCLCLSNLCAFARLSAYLRPSPFCALSWHSTASPPVCSALLSAPTLIWFLLLCFPSFIFVHSLPWLLLCAESAGPRVTKSTGCSLQ